MSSGANTVVPANRLGQLLIEARQRSGEDLEGLAAASRFTVGELADFEAGHRVLTDVSIEEITALYELDCGPIIPQRAILTIDLNQNLLHASGHALPLESDAHQHVLDRYLSLVYVLRDTSPGASVPLRGEDLDILAASLAERRELVEEQLLAAMAVENTAVPGLVGWFKRRLWVPAAGAIVSAVSIGTLVMVSAPTDAPTETTDQPEPEPEPGRGLLSAGIGTAVAAPSTDATTTTNQPTTTTTEQTAAANTSSTVETTTTTETNTQSTTSTSSTTSSTTTSTSSTSTSAAPAVALATVQTPQQLGAQAEALLPFDWQQVLPGWKINYLGQNDRFRGLTYPYEKSIDMFVRDTDTPQSLAGILAHEIAHAIDVEHFDDGDRNDWRNARGIGGAPWWPDAYAGDFQTGAGDFAESFAYWALGDASSSQLGGNPTANQLALIDQLFSNI